MLYCKLLVILPYISCRALYNIYLFQERHCALFWGRSGGKIFLLPLYIFEVWRYKNIQRQDVYFRVGRGGEWRERVNRDRLNAGSFNPH